MVRDGLVFKDENGQVIFNQYSFCELVKHLLVELVGISYEAVSYTHLSNMASARTSWIRSRMIPPWAIWRMSCGSPLSGTSGGIDGKCVR